MNDETLLEKVGAFVTEVNWWDKVFWMLYLVVFGILGILMKVGVVDYATTIQELFKNANSLYTIYISAFICITITNVALASMFFFSRDGAGRIIKKKIKYHYDYDGYFDIEKIIGSILSVIVALIINILLFPMFQVIYFAIILLCLLGWVFVG